jgi:TonB family protein
MSLDNLFHWSAQIALVTLAGAAVMWLMRIDVPALRHAFWRVLLAAGLALPIVQPWSTPVSVPPVPLAGEVLPAAAVPVASGAAAAPPSRIARIARDVADHWLAWIGFVLAAGVAARFAWLGAGILRLHRLCRAGVAASLGGEYDDLVGQIRARAELRFVPRIGQPVTFGLFRPIVLLPDWFATLSPAIRRVVLAHELWHVRRRDWGWVLVEESIRAVLWFNPAVSWIVSKVQATREEVVDELTVQCTSTRKAYLEALLVFADQPTLFPATPLARRRHLFHRMLLISREAVMSPRRVVNSFAVASAMVVAAGWYSVLAFPLVAPAAGTAPVPQPAAVRPAVSPRPQPTGYFVQVQGQTPARDRRPGEPAPETARERDLKAQIKASPSSRDLYFQLIGLQQARGAQDAAAATVASLRRAFPNDVAVLSFIARTASNSGRFDDAITALNEIAALDPANPRSHQVIATFYWEKAYKDLSLPPQQRMEYVQAGIAATDRALAADPAYVDALVYKNILLRMAANLDPANRDSLVAQADALRNRAMELQRARGGGSGGVNAGTRRDMEFVPAPGQAAPPPPPPPPPPSDLTSPVTPPVGAPVPEFVDGLRPVRIGGAIKPPAKIRDVKPIYPPIAQSSRIQGVVIIQAVIDTAGNVAAASVLRSIPLLDQAALEAVGQWQFQPTLLNGVLTPVVMTVTVNFVME